MKGGGAPQGHTFNIMRTKPTVDNGICVISSLWPLHFLLLRKWNFKTHNSVCCHACSSEPLLFSLVSRLMCMCVCVCVCVCEEMGGWGGKRVFALLTLPPSRAPSSSPCCHAQALSPLAQSGLAAQEPCVSAPCFEELKNKNFSETVSKRRCVKRGRRREREGEKRRRVGLKVSVSVREMGRTRSCTQKDAVFHVVVWSQRLRDTSVGLCLQETPKQVSVDGAMCEEGEGEDGVVTSRLQQKEEGGGGGGGGGGDSSSLRLITGICRGLMGDGILKANTNLNILWTKQSDDKTSINIFFVVANNTKLMRIFLKFACFWILYKLYWIRYKIVNTLNQNIMLLCYVSRFLLIGWVKHVWYFTFHQYMDHRFWGGAQSQKF